MPASSTNEVKQQALRAVVWVSVDKWATRLMSLGTFAVLGRLLAPADFGLVALAAVFVAMLGLFVDAGFSQVLIQRATLSSPQIATAFWTSGALSLLMYGAVAAAARPLAQVYDQPQLAPVLYVLGLMLPITAISSVPSSLLVREFAFKTLAIRSLSGVVVGTVAGVGAALAGWGVWAIVVQSLSGAVVSAAVLWATSAWRPAFEFSLAELRGMVGFGLSILGTEAVNLINSQADKLVVGSFLGPTALGYYYVGSRLVGVVSDLLTVVISKVSLTTFSRLQDQPDKMMRAYYSATFASASVALPAFGALAVLAPTLVPVVFGAGWGPSVLIMQLLVPAAAISSILYFDKSALLARGFSRDMFLLAVVNTVTGLVVVIATAPFGAVAVAASRSVRQVLFWPVRQFVMRRRLDLDVRRYLSQFSRPLTSTALSVVAMAGLSHVVPGPDLIVVLAAGSGGVAVYAAAMWLVARDQIRQLVGSARSASPGNAAADQLIPGR